MAPSTNAEANCRYKPLRFPMHQSQKGPEAPKLVHAGTKSHSGPMQTSPSNTDSPLHPVVLTNGRSNCNRATPTKQPTAKNVTPRSSARVSKGGSAVGSPQTGRKGSFDGTAAASRFRGGQPKEPQSSADSMQSLSAGDSNRSQDSSIRTTARGLRALDPIAAYTTQIQLRPWTGPKSKGQTAIISTPRSVGSRSPTNSRRDQFFHAADVARQDAQPRQLGGQQLGHVQSQGPRFIHADGTLVDSPASTTTTESPASQHADFTFPSSELMRFSTSSPTHDKRSAAKTRPPSPLKHSIRVRSLTTESLPAINSEFSVSKDHGEHKSASSVSVADTHSLRSSSGEMQSEMASVRIRSSELSKSPSPSSHISSWPVLQQPLPSSDYFAEVHHGREPHHFEDGGGGRTSCPQSPSKLTAGMQTPRESSELALQARRERKVMDLEISNSSLMAINRALEREMRRQNHELRRYQRMVRTVSISSHPSVPINMLGSTDSTDLEAANLDSGPSDAHSSDTDLSDDEPSFAGSSDFSGLNLAAQPLAKLDLDGVGYRRRSRRTGRFRLDLAKHQEQLQTRQRMDQSLLRCLGWTAELIAEGERALHFRVRVSDVQVGGRVLRAEEHPSEAFSEADAT